MHLWFRLLWLLLMTPFRPRLTLPSDVSRLRMRVMPNDLDTNFHMNNGRYLTIMDLGRLDMILRAGLWDIVRKKMWAPVLGAAHIRYRLSLDLWQSYTLETRILCWEDPWFTIEQRFIINNGPKAGAVAAIALVRGGFYHAGTGRTVPLAEALSLLNITISSPETPAYVRLWQDAEQALKAQTAKQDTHT